MEVKYTKLSNLVNDTFTVEKAYGYSWKKWDTESGRFLLADKYEEGYRKVYTVETDKGKLDLGSGQLSSLLEATYDKGRADIVGKTFTVKSNGKTGMDIRYYFNPTKTVQPIKEEEEEPEFDLSDIPF